LEGEGEVSKSVGMARAYVRLWLALSEVKGRDPHPVVATAAAVVIRRVTAQSERDLEREGSGRGMGSGDRSGSLGNTCSALLLYIY
jgi:hypothetical protein